MALPSTTSSSGSIMLWLFYSCLQDRPLNPSHHFPFPGHLHSSPSSSGTFPPTVFTQQPDLLKSDYNYPPTLKLCSSFPSHLDQNKSLFSDLEGLAHSSPCSFFHCTPYRSSFYLLCCSQSLLLILRSECAPISRLASWGVLPPNNCTGQSLI